MVRRAQIELRNSGASEWKKEKSSKLCQDDPVRARGVASSPARLSCPSQRRQTARRPRCERESTKAVPPPEQDEFCRSENRSTRALQNPLACSVSFPDPRGRKRDRCQVPRGPPVQAVRPATGAPTHLRIAKLRESLANTRDPQDLDKVSTSATRTRVAVLRRPLSSRWPRPRPRQPDAPRQAAKSGRTGSLVNGLADEG
jgi:hypothetical protein